ncbi:MAG: DUF1440 domain-containing protein [Isosphaeraceae bacterium]|nr:DUF1440 domain-containing protein [Isosphaeraceae bacterium]
MNELVIGAMAGCAATAPMTWAMEVMHRNLPHHERHPLPPWEIVERVAEKAVGQEPVGETEHFWLTLVAHFAYGAAAGSVFGPVAQRLALPRVLGGTAYGLVVWAGSYFGLLPALGIMRPATQHPMRRTALMIAAHLVWGSALGIFVELLENAGGLPSLGSRPQHRGGGDGEYPRRARVSDEAGTP